MNRCVLTSHQNIEKAKKEIARLEAEEAAGGSSSNGDKVADVTKDLKETKLEDKAEAKA